MAWTACQAVIALILLAPIRIVAHLAPRQSTFNETAKPTVTTSQPAVMPTPPPCCWIVVGQFAVGYVSWYSSTAEQVVGAYNIVDSLDPRALTTYSSHCCDDLLSQAQWHRGRDWLYHDTEALVRIFRASYMAYPRHMRTQNTWCAH